jgi:hypothetical protein
MGKGRIGRLLAAAVVVAAGLGAVRGSASEQPGLTAGKGPRPASLDRLAFGPDGELFIADNTGAAIYAVELDRSADAKPGVKPVAGLDKLAAAMMGVEPNQIMFTDLAVDPKTGQAYVSAQRASGESALFRVDGSGQVKPVSLAGLAFAAVALPNPPPLVPGYRGARATTVTDMAYDDGHLYVAGLSNEEFASNLRSIAYPFHGADRGTGIEIFHTSHGDYETRSPVYTFLPMRFEGRPELLAAYLCTPLVRLPVEALKPGTHVRGTTIAEMGRHNRPLDMVRYRKDGEDFILMANSRRGLLKVKLAAVDAAAPIPDLSAIDTHDLGATRVRTLTDVEQIDLAGPDDFAALTRDSVNGVELRVVGLP